MTVKGVIPARCADRKPFHDLSISLSTVNNHRASIMEKLSLNEATDLVKYAIREMLCLILGRGQTLALPPFLMAYSYF